MTEALLVGAVALLIAAYFMGRTDARRKVKATEEKAETLKKVQGLKHDAEKQTDSGLIARLTR